MNYFLLLIVLAAIFVSPLAQAEKAVTLESKVSVNFRTASGNDEMRSYIAGGGKNEGFRDCFNPECLGSPEMVVVPAGKFKMGSAENEPGRWAFNEKQIEVAIRKPFAVGKYAITRDQFNAFVVETKREMPKFCRGESKQETLSWLEPGFNQAGSHPVVCISRNDARDYANWLSKKTGKKYRLLSESEREYVTRAGTETPFWWGKTISPNQANYDSTFAYEGGETGQKRGGTVPVESFAPNPWGLFQVHGNVGEWVEDCWNNIDMNASSDGSVRSSRNCIQAIARGGSWKDSPGFLRSSSQSLIGPLRIKTERDKTFDEISRNDIGFRLARTLEPTRRK